MANHAAIQPCVPGNADKQLPISTAVRPTLPQEQQRLFREVLTLMNERQVPYVVSGAFALQEHTGIFRDTKDLDLFLPPEYVGTALRYLQEDGFATEVRDPVWLAKAHRGEYFVDLITGMSNGVITVDMSWIARSKPASVLRVPSRVLAAEELLASKLFVTFRERFDGADICHVIYGTRGQLDWPRILQMAGEHWDLVLWNLVLFRYVYPAHSHYVPAAIWETLLGRLQQSLAHPGAAAPFRGSLIDENMFAIDTKEWGLPDLLNEYRRRREPKIQAESAEPAA